MILKSQKQLLKPKALTEQGINLLTGASYERIVQDEDIKKVHVEVNSEKRIVESEQLLIASGRKPNTDLLNLHVAGVEVGSHGEVFIDEYCKTTNSRIYASGDVTLGPQFVYVASYQGGIVAHNAIDGIFVFDRDHNLVDMNYGAVKLSEWEMDEAISTHTMDSLFKLTRSIDLNDLFACNQSSVNVDEGVLIGKNREGIPINATFTLIPNERREEEKIAVIVRDLTERKQMENIIKGLYSEASQKQLEAETQYRIAKRIASIRDFSKVNDQPILKAVTKDIKKLLSAEYVALFLFNFETESFDLIALANDNNKQVIKNLFSQHMKETNLENETSPIQIKVIDETLFIPLQREDTLLGYLITGRQKEIMQNLQKQELVNSISNSLSIFFENWLMNLRLKNVAIIEERERLAREMHDGVSQEIISIQLRVQFLKHLIQEKNLFDDPEISNTINEITKIVNIAHHEVRHNLFNLRTKVLEDEPFVNSIKNYIKKFSEQNNIQIDSTYCKHCYDKEMSLSDYTKMHIMRIIQEALSNTRRHASASKIEINLQCNKKDTSVLTIKDNGIGFNYNELDLKGHYGLETMKERAKLIKGSLTIFSEVGKGVKIELTFPLGRW